MESNAKQLENKQVIVTDMDALIAHIKGLEDRNAELLAALRDLIFDVELENDSGNVDISLTNARAAIENVDWSGSKGVINESLEIINEIENSNNMTNEKWQLIPNAGMKNTDENYWAIKAGEGFFDDENPDAGFDMTGFISPKNARLIAAAPDLLAALKDLLDEQNDAPLEKRRAQWEDAMNEARVILSK